MIFRPVYGGPIRPVGPAPAPVYGGPAYPVGPSYPAGPVGPEPYQPGPLASLGNMRTLPQNGPMAGPPGTRGSFHKGGKVPATGKYMLKKGEHVIPASKKKGKKVRLVGLMVG